MTIECYKRMYAILGAAASETVDLLSDPNKLSEAKSRLEAALLEAEELYLSREDT